MWPGASSGFPQAWAEGEGTPRPAEQQGPREAQKVSGDLSPALSASKHFPLALVLETSGADGRQSRPNWMLGGGASKPLGKYSPCACLMCI